MGRYYFKYNYNVTKEFTVQYRLLTAQQKLYDTIRDKREISKISRLECFKWDRIPSSFIKVSDMLCIYHLFVRSCLLDLSKLEKERTHDIWQELDDGYGSVHLSVTMCVVRYLPSAPKTIKTDFQREQVCGTHFIIQHICYIHFSLLKAFVFPLPNKISVTFG